MVVAANFELFGVDVSGKIAVLAHGEVIAVSADETGSDDGSHVAAHTLVVVVGSQPVG